MARTGRPKADKPFDHKVTVKFKEEEYQIMVEYAETHNLSISQLIRMGVELQLKLISRTGSFLRKGENNGL